MPVRLVKASCLLIMLFSVFTGYQSHSARVLLESIKAAVHTSGDNFSPAPGGSPFGIHYRTLGNVAYFMPSLNTPSSVIRAVEERVWDVLQTHSR